MVTIFLNTYEHHLNQTFLMVMPTKAVYEVGEKFIFTERSNQNFIFVKYLMSKRTMKLSDLDANISYLDKNCNEEDYQMIMNTNFPKRKSDLFDVMIFTDKCNVKTLNHAVIEDFSLRQKRR